MNKKIYRSIICLTVLACWCLAPQVAPACTPGGDATKCDQDSFEVNAVACQGSTFTEKMQNAIATGKPIVITGGNHLLEDVVGDGYALCLGSGTKIRGAGMAVTVLQLASGQSGVHLLGGIGLDDVTISDLTLQGAATGGDGLHFEDGATQITLRDLDLRETGQHGISFFNGASCSAEAGPFEAITIDNVTVTGPAWSGIEIRNQCAASGFPNNDVSLHDITVVFDASALDGYAGLDIFGRAHLSHINVEGAIGLSSAGIRFQETAAGQDDLSTGASLVNFQIAGDEDGVQDRSFGLYNLARDLSVSNGVIQHVKHGVYLDEGCSGSCDDRLNSRLLNVTVKQSSGLGFWVLGNDVRLTNCSAIDNVLAGFRIIGDEVFVTSGFTSCNGGGGVEVRKSDPLLPQNTLLLGNDLTNHLCDGTPLDPDGTPAHLDGFPPESYNVRFAGGAQPGSDPANGNSTYLRSRENLGFCEQPSDPDATVNCWVGAP